MEDLVSIPNRRKYEVTEIVRHSKDAVKTSECKGNPRAAAAIEDATKEPTEKQTKGGKVEMYAEKVKVYAGVKTAEASRADVTASTTSASNTTRRTVQRAAEAYFQTKTYLDIHRVDCTGRQKCICAPGIC